MIDIHSVREEFADIEELVPLSSGGQKIVFRGLLSGEQVVLKLIKRADQEEERLEREIEAAAKLECDYVPKVLDWGRKVVSGEDQFFVIEEFIGGENYRTILEREPVQSLTWVLKLTDVLLSACCDFEAARIVHRDIKPENLIVDRDGKIWVIDFGIVRFLDAPSLTSTTKRFGFCTLGYGPPEQMRNNKPEIDSRADLFAVGVVVHESLSGSNLYYAGKRDQIEIIRHVCDRDLPRLRIEGDDAGEFADLIAALTARYPSRRPQTAEAAFTWFREVQTHLSS